MKDKYFVPDIEDLRVGYECKIFRYLSGRYEKEIIDSDLLAEIMTDDSYTFQTPYLTKEQIEVEGWSSQHVPNIVQDDELQDGYCKSISGTISYNLLYIETELLIYKQTIYNEVTGNWTADVLFQGECKSINELRYICKLLKI